MSDFKLVSVLGQPVLQVNLSQTGPVISAGTNSWGVGTVVFSNSNGVSFGMDNAGIVTASVGAGGGQSVQTQPSGNIAGAGFTSTTTAGSNIVATHNSNGLSMGVPAFLTAAAGGTNYVFSNSNNVSFGTNGSTVTASATFNQTVDTNKAGVGYSSTTQAGTTAGVTNNTAGLSIAWPPFLTTTPSAQTTQTQAAGNIAGTGYTSTTQAGSTIGITHNTAGLSLAHPPFITTYAAQTNQTAASGNIAGVGTTFAGTNVSGSMTLNSAGLALNLSAGAGGGGADGYNSAQFTNSTANSTMPLVWAGNSNGSGNVTIGLTGSTITMSAPSGGGAGDGYNIIGINGGATQLSTTYQLSNANNVSFGLNAGTITASASYPAQTVDTNKAGVGYTSTTQAGAVVGVTNNTVGLSMAWPPFITTYANDLTSGRAGVGFTSTSTAGVVPVATLSTNGLSMGVPAWITTYAAQTTQTQASGNIAGAGYTSTTQAGSTLGVTHNSAGLSLAQPPFITTYVAQSTQTQPAGNIAGVGTTFGGTNVSGSMTMNSNGLALSLSAAAPGGGGAINVAAGTTNGNLQTLSFVNGNGVSFGLNGSTVTASAAGGGGAAVTGFWFQPEVFGNTMTSTHAPGTVYMRPFELDGYMDVDKYILQQSMASSISTGAVTASVSAGSASSGTGTWGVTGTVVLYSRVNTNETNASYNSIVSFASDSYSMSAGYSSSVSWSTNASSCTASWTTSAAIGYIKNIDAAGGFTTGSTGTSGSSTFSSTSTNANSFSSTYQMSFPYAHMSGIRPLFVPGGQDLVPGEYWLGHQHSSQSGSTNDSRIVRNAVMQPSMLYFTASTNNYLEIGNSVAITTSNYRVGFGSYSASSNTTGNIGLSHVSIMASNASIWFALDGKTL